MLLVESQVSICRLRIRQTRPDRHAVELAGLSSGFSTDDGEGGLNDCSCNWLTIMTRHSDLIAVLAAAAALICCVGTITSSNEQLASKAADIFPTGHTSPEGAACDLMRAYMSKDADLFEERRCKQSCEGSLDPTIAYDQLLGYRPQPLEALAGTHMPFVPPIRIADVLTSQRCPLSAEETALSRFELLLNYGAVESRFIDIITATADGHRYITLVEAIHIGRHADDHWSKLTPTGQWRARIINTSVAQAIKP